MGPTKLTLTSFQQRQLAPLFAEIRAGNARGEAGAIMAQILPDGMILKAVTGKALEALQTAGIRAFCAAPGSALAHYFTDALNGPAGSPSLFVRLAPSGLSAHA